LEYLMENTLNYQFNYGAQPAQPVPLRIDPSAPLFASEDGMVASLSSHECIFVAKRTGEPHVMTFQVLQALDQCREFRTLDEHIARIQSTISGLTGKRDEIKRVLDSLAQRELLVSDQQFFERVRSAPATPPKMRAVFIRACDRPAQIEQLLRSLTDYERRFRAGRHYIVLDDSVLPAHVDEQRDLLREFARTTGCKASYIGQAERTRLVEKLSRARPQGKDVIARLLTREAHSRVQRFGGGRGINLSLLLGAGARFALLDDDLRLPLKRPDYARPGLDANPGAIQVARFYPSMEEALRDGNEIEQDPFELHLEVCGQPLGALAQYPLERSALRGMNMQRLDLLSNGSHAVTTHHGTYGSSRTEVATWLYSLDDESRARFWQDRASYLRNIEAQFVWQGVAQARALEVAGFTPFMLDNSRLLPCTNPVGRGEDSLASALTRYCHPDAVAFEMPEAIGHAQETARKRSDKTQSADVPRVNHFLRDYVQRQFGLFKAADTAQRLGLLANVLRDLAGASSDDRIAHLREYLGYVRANTIDRLQHQLEAATSAPIYWQADVRSIVQANAKVLLSNASPRLGDWSEDLDDPGCAAALAEELTDMADALEHWPGLWQHAAEQGEKLLTGL
jgi:hypothetical protein